LSIHVHLLDYLSARTQLVTFEDNDYVCKIAANVKEATTLIEARARKKEEKPSKGHKNKSSLWHAEKCAKQTSDP